MQKTILLFFTFLILLSSCNNPVTSEKSTPRPKVNEDDLVARLAVELIASPHTQKEKDQNIIINYAIDKLLDVQATDSGLYYQILKEGQGEKAKWGDYVRVNYKGTLTNGKPFDAAKKYQFYVGNMIAGWNEGLALMNKGSKAIFLIPSHLAYGEKGLGKIIPPNAVLIFELELLDVAHR
ncbi:MAG TPA: hypothetical protein ENK52_02890 [Saprospiraceae bacterium]|nr:hypothetical protein [Saprospiraceae bacterium]